MREHMNRMGLLLMASCAGVGSRSKALDCVAAPDACGTLRRRLPPMLMLAAASTLLIREAKWIAAEAGVRGHFFIAK